VSGLFASFSIERIAMTPSKTREQAEAAFSSIRAHSSSKSRAVEEVDMIASAREAKTLRLREARLAKEAEANLKR
jgi:hypothetical protein